MPVNQGHPLLEILGHHHQRVVDGAVPVRMIFTHGIAHDTRAFPVGPVIANAQLIHIIERPALHRLEAVPHIGKGPGYDDAHGIVDEGLLHDLGIFCFYDLLFQIFTLLFM